MWDNKNGMLYCQLNYQKEGRDNLGKTDLKRKWLRIFLI